VTSLAHHELRPGRFASCVRSHWNIENGSHWQRDKLWREDGHLMRDHNRAHILSSLRQLALHLLTLRIRDSKDRRMSRATATMRDLKPLALALIKQPYRE
jgi:predicted transposase YbfD/YdcC